MNHDFQTVKDRLNIKDEILAATGLKMKGKHLAECPFCGGHECFSIDEDKGYYHCFQCPAKGDIFTFWENKLGLTRAESLKKGAEKAGVTLQDKKKKAREKGNLSISESIFLDAASYYHEHMLKNGGRAYLTQERGHSEMNLRTKMIGWSDGNLVEHLRAQGYNDEEILRSGIAKFIKVNDADHLVDYFPKGLAIFPHLADDRVMHFTQKDPNKKLKYQLPNEHRAREWRFYNQDAVNQFSEVILVEGENDVLSVMDAGVGRVMGFIGQPADYQIKSLKAYGLKKHFYLWFDSDDAGKKYTRKLCEELKGQNVRVMVIPSGFKDPDEYIQKFQGDRKKEVQRLLDESVDPVTWEIGEIGTLPDREARLEALKERKVFIAISGMPEAEQAVFVEKLTKLGFSEAAMKEQIEQNGDLSRDLALYFENELGGNKRNSDPNRIASIIYNHFSQHGRFFYDRTDSAYLLFNNKTYEIGNNLPFNALMKKNTSLLYSKEPGRSVWESLAAEAYIAGTRMDITSWLSTDRTTDTIYVNLNSSGNAILKISPDSIEEIPNGLNKEGVMLKSSRKILPMNYHPDVTIREGMQALKELIFDNMTCEKEQKYLILCWLMSAFMIDFAPYYALMKFSGSTSSGKTTAARLLSLLIYGNDHLGDPSAAAAYAVASQNPLLIIDNLESDDFTKSILKFLLLSATKGEKSKRTAGTESETTEEAPKALVLITAIEPFEKAELINRTYDIEFSSRHKNDGFVEDEVVRQLIKKRDVILSAILKLIQKEILPNLEKRKEFITVLKKEYKNHSKNRTDEFLALLMLTLEKILPYIPYFAKDDFEYGTVKNEDIAADLWGSWIDYQNAQARESETGSNNIVTFLDGLVREYMVKMKDIEPQIHSKYHELVYAYTHSDYMIEMIRTLPEDKFDGSGQPYVESYIEFVATSDDISQAFNRFAKNNGIKNPYNSASKFTARLRNDMSLFKKMGWDIIAKEEIEPYFTRIQGKRFLKLRKMLVR